MLTILVSTTIEIVQLNIGRTFDIDDIILNAIGGIIGYLLYIGISSITNRLPEALKKDSVINIIVVIIILIILIYASNLNIMNFFS